MRLLDVARAAVPGEEVVAAGIFQASGSLTARMSGFGEFSVRHREREERVSSGLHFKRYMLLVVTPSQLHVFDARSAMTRWNAGERLATWDRSAIRAWTDAKLVTTRLTLEIPSENRRIELEAPKARRSTAGEVARILASQPTSAPGFVTPTRSPSPALEAADAELVREQHNRAGGMAVTGGLARLLAYTLPWIVVTSTYSGRSVSISGYRTLGAPVLSIGYSIAIVVAGVFYLLGRDGSPRLILSLGIGSIVVFLIQLSTTLSRMGPLRVSLQARGLTVTSTLGFGVWVELAGVLLTFAGGLCAYSLWRRTRTLPGRYIPHRPVVATSAGSGKAQWT
jgi:hypothetical protein